MKQLVKKLCFHLVVFVVIVQSHASSATLRSKREGVSEIELFVMSYCPYAIQAEQSLLPFLEENPAIDFKLGFIVNPEFASSLSLDLADGPRVEVESGVTSPQCSSGHGRAESEENLRQFVISIVFPENLLKYLKLRNRNIQETDWRECAFEAGLDPQVLEKLCKERQIIEEFRAQDRQVRKLGISRSPTIFVNGEVYRGSWRKIGLAKVLCRNNKSEFCQNIPECEIDTDCYKIGYYGKCYQRKCIYEPTTQFNVYVISSSRCHACSSVTARRKIRQFFPGAIIHQLNVEDADSRPLLNSVNLDYLPMYILEQQVSSARFFKDFVGEVPFIEKRDKYYVVLGEDDHGPFGMQAKFTLKDGGQTEVEEDYHRLAVYYYAKADIEKSESMFNNAIAKDPNNPALYVNLGALYANKARDYDRALKCFKKALALSPGHVIAHQNTCNTYRILGDSAKLSDSLIAFGGMLMKRRFYDRAILAYQSVPDVEYAPNACYGLGRAYLFKGQYEKAAKWLSKTVNLDPKHASAFNALGGLAFRLNQPDQAVKAYRLALRLAPSNQTIAMNLITALLELGRPVEALDVAKAHIPKRSGKVKIEWIWGRVFVVLSQVEEAAACFERIRNNPALSASSSQRFGVPLATMIVDAALKQGRFDVAEYVSRKAIEQYGPLHYELGYSVGRVLAAKGDRQNGLRIMRICGLAMGMPPSLRAEIAGVVASKGCKGSF